MTSTLDEANSLENSKEQELEKLIPPQASPWRYEISFPNVVYFLYLHLAGLYGLILTGSAKWPTLVFMYVYFLFGSTSITAGAHRLWAHRAYKAKWPLRTLLMLGHSSTLQLSVTWWVLTHRQHHKYSDTDGDPHNATRGLFYSHIGWFLVRNRHPEVLKRRKYIQTSDILSDPVLKFQKRYALFFVIAMSIILPVLGPAWCWGESFTVAWYVNCLRVAAVFNCAASVNSFAHGWGYKPYDKNIVATQNTPVSFVAFGEGFHNYHHAFPWDYRVAELGNYWLNFTTWVIDVFAYFGWAYDLKTASKQVVDARVARTGDGTDLWGFKHKEVVKDFSDDPLVKLNVMENLEKTKYF